jgi:hypothetical protein
VSVWFDLLGVGAGLAVARWLARAIRTRREPRSARSRDSSAPARAADADLLARLPCKLGDVIVRVVERDEAWLAGALVFQERAIGVAALFVAPEAGGDRAVFVRGAPGADLTWLAPLPQSALPLAGEPPYALEHSGEHFERVRRLPLRVERVGEGAPDVGEQAVVAEYAGHGAERIVVVAGAARRLAWRGLALAAGQYEVLPGAKSSLPGGP